MPEALKVAVQQFLIRHRMIPDLKKDGTITHKFTFQEIADMANEKYGTIMSKSTVRRICMKNGVKEQFNKLTSQSLTKENIVDAADDNVLMEHLSKLEEIFRLDLDIVETIALINHSYVKILFDKLEGGKPIEPVDIEALASIGDGSSKRVMKLFEFVLSNSKEEKEINVFFPDGMDFKEDKKEDDV